MPVLPSGGLRAAGSAVSSSVPSPQPSSSRPPTSASVPAATGDLADRGGDDAERLAGAQRRRAPRCAVAALAPALQHVRRLFRVERPVGGLELVRVRHERLVLLLERRPLAERPHQQVAAEHLEPGRERAVVVVRGDRHRRLQADRTRVEPGGETHDRDAGLGVAGHDRPLDRRGAAPARQQRRVHVQELVVRQQRLLDQHAVGADAERVRLRGGDPLERLRVVQPLGLDQVEAELARAVGDRRRREPAAAALGPVRSRDDERGGMRARGEALEDGGGEVGGAEVDRAHASGADGVRGRALAQGAHRLLALVAARAVEDQDAVEVVDLVLDHARLEA